MKVLTSATETFDLNQSDMRLLDLQYCVYDYSDDKNRDFMMAHISQYSSYRYPTVELMVNNKFFIELPANWMILTTWEGDRICQMSSIDELLHQRMYVPVFNPYNVSFARIVPVEVTNINSKYIEHFCPRLAKKNILVLPLGKTREDGYPIYEKDKMGESVVKDYYPYCIMGWDNADASKCTIDFYYDIIGEEV